MDSGQVVRCINREPKSLVGLVLGQNPQTVQELSKSCACILGFESSDEMISRVAGLAPTSIERYFDYSLGEITDGSKESGFFLREELKGMGAIFSHVLQWTSRHDMSMYSIFGRDTGAIGVYLMLSFLARSKDARVQDAHEECKISVTSVTKHAKRLERLGFVCFEHYEEGVKFGSNPKKSLDTLQSDLEVRLRRYRAPEWVRGRSMCIAAYLYQHQGSVFSSSELTAALRCSTSKSSVALTEHGLRHLEYLGYAVPSNDFRGGVRQTKLNVTEAGKKFAMFFESLMSPDLEALSLDHGELRRALKAYSSISSGRCDPRLRMAQIQRVVAKNPGCNHEEISRLAGHYCGKYLLQMVTEGKVRRKGDGKLGSRYTYYPLTMTRV